MWWVLLSVAGVCAVVLAVRGYTNCLYVALGMWLRNRCRTWVAVRRTVNLQGKGMHFAHIEEGATTLEVVDYIPLHAKQSFVDTGDSVLAFKGTRRRRVYVLSECVFDTDTSGGAAFSDTAPRGIFRKVFTSKQHDRAS